MRINPGIYVMWVAILSMIVLAAMACSPARSCRKGVFFQVSRTVDVNVWDFQGLTHKTTTVSTDSVRTCQ